jgi:hypothetical protein
MTTRRPAVRLKPSRVMKTVERAPAELPPLPRLSLARVASFRDRQAMGVARR